MVLKRTLLILGGLMLGLLSACGQAGNAPTAQAPQTQAVRRLTIMTHDSFAASEAVLAAFEEQHNVEIQILLAGDAGTAVNKAVLARGAPLADVFYGLDNTFLSRALEEDLFEAYESPLLSVIPQAFQLDPEHRALPVDYGDVCLNYDLAYFETRGLTPPANLDDLLKPEYAGLLVVESPVQSSPGLAFLMATIGYYGEDGYLPYWEALLENGTKVVNNWESAYYGEFSRWGGNYPIVVSYSSSPPFEMIFAETALDAPPTAAIVSDGSCFRQIEFVGILKGTQNRDLAEAFIDFMLSPTFQEDIPRQMYVFPVNPQAQLEETFIQFLVIPENPVSLDPALIAAQRETWINAWNELYTR